MKPVIDFVRTPAELHIMGSRMHTLIRGRDSDRKLAIVQIDCDAAGVHVPTHVHHLEDETFHVLEGSLRVTVDGQDTIVSAGQTGFGPRGVPHSWVALEPCKFLVSVTPAGLDEFFIELAAMGPRQQDMQAVKNLSLRYGIEFV